MRGLDALIKLHRFQLDEKRRTLLDLESMRERLEASLRELEDEVSREQAAARTSIEATRAYGPYARAALDRRQKLTHSLREATREIENAREVVAEAYAELKKYEVAKAGRERAAALAANRREQIALDELGLARYRRAAGQNPG